MNTVANGREDILQIFLDILNSTKTAYCTVGGLAVNAYVEPVVSLVRIQIQTDSRYQDFLSSASSKEVLGYKMNVASVEDVLLGKVWAYSDDKRRMSKRQKDLADIIRLIEAYPSLEQILPSVILENLKQLK